MKANAQKKTLLQVAQGNAETKACKRVFFSPAQEKLKKSVFANALIRIIHLQTTFKIKSKDKK